ncbi:MAG: S4 domain-containing protein, partial [Enterococcus aquimarinus]
PKDGWTQEKETVSSLRLDTVISTVFNISRQRSKQLIESGKIKVNWVESERPDFMLDLLDIVSIRGFGRLQIQSIEGKTKKEKIKLTLGVLRK